MRCVVVNEANLKAEAFCAHCAEKIGDRYLREIRTRLIYCDYHCYSVAVESAILTPQYRIPPRGAWTMR